MEDLALLQSLEAEQPLMIEQLHQLCEINSGTGNLVGLAAVCQTLQEHFKPLADLIDVLPMTPVKTISMAGEEMLQYVGNTLLIRKRPELKRRVLLTGHMDTVYPDDDAFQTLTYESDNRLNGPGVADMKGGLVVIHQALQTFEKSSAASSLGWDVLINADEEIGSPASSDLLHQIAPNYQAGLVYEPAMNEKGLFARHRRGSGKYTLIATGKPAHVGRAFNEGRNAICYLAEIILAIHELNKKHEGITINIGKIAGGSALNVVADKAVAKLDIRITNPRDEQWVINEFHAIFQQFKREGYTLMLQGSFGRPVKEIKANTMKLFQRLKAVGQQLQLPIDWQDSGGCCDGNNLSQQGLAVIDTLGVRGGNIHSPQEYILLDSLVERARLSTLLLMDLAQGGLEELAL